MRPAQILSTSANIVTLPARLALKARSRLFGGKEQSPEPPPEQRRPAGPAGQRDPAPKPLNDTALTRKVETVIYRVPKVQKGKIDVNCVDGVVWLRGEAKTPDLINQLERRTAEVPEVRGVENLLHLPKTPAPSRTDQPEPMRKTRRSKPKEPRVEPSPVTGEQPAPDAEPTPAELARERSGRPPSPLDG